MSDQDGKYYTASEREFRKKNYTLWWHFIVAADEVRDTGRKHYSARTIAEVLRHNSVVRGEEGQYKINNNMIPVMARMYMKLRKCPGFFELRNKEKQDDTKTGK